ncbi:sulfate transporter family-domain-containing protein [Hysterangium stoloniferum]|nr:sulfate transporter family-domain-containing protein [Hysterangium stoloniferum]
MAASPSAFSKAKTFGKKIIGYPENHIQTVSSREWVFGLLPHPRQQTVDYIKSLFPIIQWIGRYNIGWATGDLIAGMTVGLVLVPQSMSYARIANLAPQFGLYSSFVGVFTYCFFATSKDVSIGPVAVMSLETGKVVARVMKAHPGQWDASFIATTLAFLCGFIVLGIGLLRLGWIVEFIPAPAVSGFMTGSAINIVAGQIPALFGIASRFDTRGSTYLVIINTFKNLHFATLDAAFGIVGLFSLYAIKWTFQYLSFRYPRHERTFFFISVLRNAFVMVILTFASWLYCRRRADNKGNYPISLLKTVPRGFQNVGLFHVDSELVTALAPDLVVATIILLLEHISISKSFGRLNGYKINPAQELIAVGVTNTIGTVFHAYPATGSFSRSALKSKSGVRTPLAGMVTGLIVIVALYGLTDAFFWIPNAALSALIIHAVADLVASPAHSFQFWRVSPLEFFIFFAAVVVTIFTTIEIGIYTSISASILLLLIRIARPQGSFLGRVAIQNGRDGRSRDVYIPLDDEKDRARARGIVNPEIKVSPPTSGVIIYRFEESFLYPNSSHVTSILMDRIKKITRRGADQSLVALADRPWNDPGPPRGAAFDPATADLHKPILKAVVLDLSAVGHLDTTSIQNLIDTRKEAERWANGPVEFHFANILSPWIRRALLAGGFGTANVDGNFITEVAPVFTHHLTQRKNVYDREAGEEIVQKTLDEEESTTSHVAPIVSTDTPFFHFDLTSAVQAAEQGADRS